MVIKTEKKIIMISFTRGFMLVEEVQQWKTPVL